MENDLARKALPDQVFYLSNKHCHLLIEMWENFEEFFQEFYSETPGPWGGEKFFYFLFNKKWRQSYRIERGYLGLVR